ncbi:methyl-accepting chemotaxis protein [Mesobacillus harenae]|uniref:methyl-accepting chemotaxis protein n=1 Tax=Mesobacillus harenae TaxID=2213203 RepID=UPI0015811174|nr:HAMP domain-containing methyl-accepting chemotaxis protein [Mesobacillus harenae]
MKIKTKFIGIIAVFVLSIAFVSVFSSMALNKTVTQNDYLKEKMEMSLIAKSIQYELTGLSNDERALLLTGEPAFAEGMEDKNNTLQQSIQDLLSLSHDTTEKELLELIDYNLIKYWALNQSIIKNVQLDAERAQRIHFAEERIVREEELEPAVNKLSENLESEVAALKRELQKNARTSQIIILSVSAIAALAGVVIAVVLLKAILKPLNTLNRQMAEIASGEADLTREIRLYNQKDEFGVLALSFNQFISVIRELVLKIGVSADQIAAASEQFSAGAEETKQTSEQVSASMQEIASGTLQQSAMAEDGLLSVRQSLQGLQAIALSTTGLADEAAAVRDQAEYGENSVNQIVSQMQSIHLSVDEADKEMSSLAGSAREISHITSLINGIAEQTNLLALNAAIEAARAGEQGRGFAVVAAEVRKLAEQSGQSSKQISELIKMIQAKTDGTVHAIHSVKGIVAEGVELTNDTATQFGEIRNSIDKISLGIKGVSATTQELTYGFEEVDKSVAEITEIMKSTSQHTHSVASATEEQSASMEEIQTGAGSLTKLSENLQEMVKRFKV